MMPGRRLARAAALVFAIVGLVSAGGRGTAWPSGTASLTSGHIEAQNRILIGPSVRAARPSTTSLKLLAAATTTPHQLSGTSNPDPGLAAIVQGAAGWASEGFTGAGVKVGIIDNGFEGLADRIGPLLPASITVRCYTGVGAFSESPADCSNGEPHGTAVVEALVRVSPGVSLFLADPTSQADLVQTVAWMTSNGVRIINHSRGSGFEGPGDGTSPYGNSTYGVVDAAVTGGSLWVNAAGNEGDTGWQGDWSAAPGSRWLQYSGTDTSNSISLTAQDVIEVELRWGGPWIATSQNYGVSIFKAGDATALADSAANPDPGSCPVARLPRFAAPATGVYEIRVWQRPGASAAHLQLLVSAEHMAVAGQLKYHVSTSTIAAPADSGNAGELTVGATNAATPTTIEPYSSRGPTIDGRTKPDLVAADCVPTTVLLTASLTFCGTSEATPFVSGAASLVLEANPTLSPSALSGWLRSHATPLGSPVPNNTFGAGLLNLGPPPELVPATTSFVEPPATGAVGAPFLGQPTTAIVDAQGRHVVVGPGSTLPVTLSLASGPSGAVLTCNGGLTRSSVGGIAAFSGCRIDRPGTYALGATAGSTTTGASSPFTVRTVGSQPPLTVVGPSSATYPNQATFVATAVRPDGAASPIVLERSTDGGISWSTVASGTTDAAGHASLATVPRQTARYRVVLGPAAGSPVEVSPAVVVTSVQRLSLSSSVPGGRTLVRGKVVNFKATVEPTGADVPRSKLRFEAYYRVGSRWVLSLAWTAAVDAAGQVISPVKLANAGYWWVRARALPTATCAPSSWATGFKYTVR